VGAALDYIRGRNREAPDPGRAREIPSETTVGTIRYAGSDLPMKFEDRFLAHLQVVIAAKLRRGEGFVFSWTDPPETANGRNSMWIDSHISIEFRFSYAARAPINPDWIELLFTSSNTTNGLVALPEPEKEADL
jgi:hypothetical protein